MVIFIYQRTICFKFLVFLNKVQKNYVHSNISHKLLNVLSIILIEHELVKTLDYLNFMNNFAKQFAKNFIDFYIPYLNFKILIMLKMQKKMELRGNILDGLQTLIDSGPALCLFGIKVLSLSQNQCVVSFYSILNEKQRGLFVHIFFTKISIEQLSFFFQTSSRVPIGEKLQRLKT